MRVVWPGAISSFTLFGEEGYRCVTRNIATVHEETGDRRRNVANFGNELWSLFARQATLYFGGWNERETIYFVHGPRMSVRNPRLPPGLKHNFDRTDA